MKHAEHGQPLWVMRPCLLFALLTSTAIHCSSWPWMPWVSSPSGWELDNLYDLHSSRNRKFPDLGGTNPTSERLSMTLALASGCFAMNQPRMGLYGSRTPFPPSDLNRGDACVPRAPRRGRLRQPCAAALAMASEALRKAGQVQHLAAMQACREGDRGGGFETVVGRRSELDL